MVVSWIRRERMWVRWGNWNAIENAIGTEIETEIGVEAEAEARSTLP